MQWYYSKNATQLGPIPIDELKAKLASGEVSGTDMVWREGLPDWRKAAEMPELLTPVVVPQQGQSPVGIPANSPYLPPGAAGGIVPVQTCGLAIASLVLGIVGMLCGLLPGIGAIICGHIALKQIADPANRLAGRGMAIAGLVLGYISLVVLVFWVLIMVLGVAAESMK